MDRRDHARVGIGQQHRHAVGGTDDQHHITLGGDEGICFRKCRTRPTVVDTIDLGAVHLSHLGEVEGGIAEIRREGPVDPPEILRTRGIVVAVIEGEVELAVRRGADPAESVREGQLDGARCTAPEEHPSR